MNESTSVEPAKCGRQRHGEPEKSSDLHGLADKAIEGLTSGVLDNQHRPPALAHELHWPQRPVGSEVVLEFVFVGETIDALERRMLGAGKDGDERVPIARSTIAPESAKGTSGVLPQHLYRVVFPTSPEQGGCLHLCSCRSTRNEAAQHVSRIRASTVVALSEEVYSGDVTIAGSMTTPQTFRCAAGQCAHDPVAEIVQRGPSRATR